MARSADVELSFGGEDRVFRLPLGRLRALQEKTDCGPFDLHRRLLAGTWRVDDLRETIRQGLIGGGMEVAAVDGLLKTEFDDLPKLQFVPVASAALWAVLEGVEDEPLPKPKAGAEKPKSRSRTAKSSSETSTAAAS